MCPSSRRGSITAARPWVPARCFVPAATGPPTWRRSSRSIAASARRNRKTSRPNDSCRSRLAHPREQQTTGHEKRQQRQDRQALIVDQKRGLSDHQRPEHGRALAQHVVAADELARLLARAQSRVVLKRKTFPAPMNQPETRRHNTTTAFDL